MPRRLALLMIAWLAWVPALFAQGQGTAPAGFRGMPGPVPGQELYQRQMLNAQLVPSRPAPFYDETPLDVAIGNVFSESWLRVEYLNYRLTEPGSRPIGAEPVTAATAPLFQATDRGGAARPGILARTTSLERTNYENNNGLRLSFGLPTEQFTFEGSFWGFAEKQNRIDHEVLFNSDITLLFPGPVIPVIPLNPITTTTGQLQDFINFDGGMRSTITTALYGIEANFVFPPITPNVAVEVSPIVGFGYMNFRNEFEIEGADQQTATFHQIDSITNNNIFGPQLGLRMEAKGKWLTLGVEPKFLFGINRNHSEVSTAQIYTDTELPFLTQDETTRFTPTVDLGAFARIHLRPNFSVTMGYDFMAMNGISLADRQIVWDSTRLPTDPPAITMDTARHTFVLHGFNVGMDWRF